MKGLASLVMRGISPAVMVITVSAMLSLSLPLFGILSAAAVGLITLRQGSRAGLKVSGLSTLAVGVMMLLILGNPLPALGILLIQLLPLWLLAMLLRTSRSLDLTVQAAFGLGLLAILGQYLLMGDPASVWLEELRPLAEQFEQSGLLTAEQGLQLVQTIAGWMAGLFAAGLFLQLVAGLFLARSWQAALYNPGGFRKEFHTFRLHRMFGVVGGLALAVVLMPTLLDAGLLRDLGVLLLVLLFLQGLAMSHSLVAKRNAGSGWLVGLYLLLIILMPQMVVVLSAIGLTDIWINFRARFKSSDIGGREGD
ncbi:DUF2232 domain-containing protein [Candidatus Endoriftia persephone]|jgi:hypothetical protein|uniref:DUF2232 domain-containing protein n=3 Tax=Gammaproteobacteria TaxID=1236 RepID=G2FCG2_9GAMM|nr:DUF2232 domain-containing protein [Candidatus Endoriftia persephone]EGV50518.1 hypothetical protein Rifp1Sym_cx00040 [endosymbiont of Riftia pachyptila (vent Ph05)]EGW55525.1 hypothetical protein TevJSym_ac00880 [endosymbiont of Tevnia jerichonana (vent Tica)]USF86675.1 DUF2232 domain-containing protein [Candidatus Endoriftia persephone]